MGTGTPVIKKQFKPSNKRITFSIIIYSFQAITKIEFTWSFVQRTHINKTTPKMMKVYMYFFYSTKRI